MTTLYKERKSENNDGSLSSEPIERNKNQNQQISRKGLKWYVWLIIAIIIVAAVAIVIFCFIVMKKKDCEKEGNCKHKEETTTYKVDTSEEEENRESNPGKGNDESGGNGNGGNGNSETGNGNNEGNENESNGEEQKNDDEEEEIDVAEIKEAFESIFKINSNINSLSQIEMILKMNSISKIDNTEDLTFIKAKIDLYVINETTPESIDFYSKEYHSAITIHSFCSELGKTDCELSDYLDLTYKETNTLRAVTDESELSEILLPICIIKHSDTNIILSVTCPKTLKQNMKNLIVSAFEGIKPKTIKGTSEDENLSKTTIETKDSKIYVTSFSKFCDDEDYNTDKTCEINSETIIDKDGNFISSKKLLKTETNIAKNNYDYTFEDISAQNSEILDPENFKSNLDGILESISNLMEKEEMAPQQKSRNLEEQTLKGSQTIKLINTSYYGINVSYLYNLDSGYEEEMSKLSSGFEAGPLSKIISHHEIQSTFKKIIDEFATLSKAGNSLSSSLYNEINDLLDEIQNIITTEFNSLDKLLIFKDLSAVFDSTFAVSGLTEFPYTIVSAAKNLYDKIKGIDEDLLYSVDDYKKQLNSDISTFLKNSHILLFNIFNNLTELNTALSSKKSKIASIASFYKIENTTTSFLSIIGTAKELLSNYFIKEKALIEPKLNELFNHFTQKSEEMVLNGQYILDNITNRLESENAHINRGEDGDIRKVIDYLYNSKLIENQIAPKIVGIMNNKLLKSNGYFESDQDLEQNNKSYSPIAEEVYNMAKKLQNNEYIDEAFDNIMKYFRNQFYEIIKFIEKSKNEQFPLKENVLSNLTSLSELEENFTNDKINISNQIKKENNDFINSIQNIINTFIQNYKEQLMSHIKGINNHLSKLNLANLNAKYDEMLSATINEISNIISYNNKLTTTYLNEIKDTTHYTNTIKNKLNIYFTRMSEVKTYVQNNLKNDLMNKYKNMINNFRKNLQSIKSNSIIKKYSEQKDLSPIFESHLLIIDPLFLRINDYISDLIFNTHYLPTINKYITNTINNINNFQRQYNNLYAPIKKKKYSSDSSNDIYYLKITSQRKCRRFLGICVSHKTVYHYNYYPKNVASTKNHLKLKKVVFDNYSKDFNNNLNKIQNLISNCVNNYNNLLLKLNNDLEKKINDISSKKVSYLNILSEKANLFLNSYLGDILLNLTYNYYKNELNKKLPKELNSILNKWEGLFDEIYNYISSNISFFKYPIEEFGTLASIYYSFYYYDMSYSYSDFVIEQIKSDFNYTLKFYYDMFISKVNRTYSYIINNIPQNEKPFDKIFSNRINEIKTSCNEIIKKAQLSQNQILNIKKQLKQFKISEEDFFEANCYANEIADKIESQLYPKVGNIDEIIKKAHNKFDSVESVSSRFYLEDLMNGKQIIDIYGNINKGTFIDFQTSAYNKLFKEVLEIDETDLKNKIKDVLLNLNNSLERSFEYEKKKYKNMLQNEAFNKFYTKSNLENKINSIYSKGLNNLDSKSKDTIIQYINEVVNLINTNLKNEQLRINDQITHYSNNFNLIQKRLNDYKTNIYQKFYSAIHSVVNDFYSQIKQKFYTDYIELYINKYYNEVKNEKFSEHHFLNYSINLKKIMDEDIEKIVSEYKNWTLNHIDFLKSKKIQELNELFVFSNIKNEINTKISSNYQNTLFKALKEKAIYNSGDEGITDYDFSYSIINGINTKLQKNIDLVKKIIISKMEGNQYIIQEDWKYPSFSNAKREIFIPINGLFQDFISIHEQQEIKYFNKSISESITNNYKLMIEGFIPSLGKDFFERVLKYNEVQKIKSLYNNLENSIGITLTYYIYLSIKSQMSMMPEDLEKKILSVNDIYSVVNLKNNEVLNSLELKLINFFDETKNDLSNNYISHMMNKLNSKNSFNESIIDLVNSIINEKKYIFENEYIKMMNTYIKKPFIEQYTKTLKSETKKMLDFIEENKEVLRIQIKDLLSMNTDESLNNIETKINNTLQSIKDYNLHFDSFKISNNVKTFLNEFIEKNIITNHKPIKDILDERTKNLIWQYLNSSIEDFKNSYIYETFETKLNETNNLLKDSYFDKIKDSIKSYGAVEQKYEDNLKKEIIKYQNKRRLESDNEIDSQKVEDAKLEKTMKSLKETSYSTKTFIETTDIFSNLNDKLNDYIYRIEEQYKISQKYIGDRQYTEDLSQQLYNNLDDLKELSLNYYNKVKSDYDKIQNYIKNSISTINNLIEKAIEVTYDTINNKYQEIKDKFNPVNDIKSGNIPVDPFFYNETIEFNDYKAEIRMRNYLVNNEISFNISVQNGEISTPKIIAKSIIKDKPIALEIDYSSFTIGKNCINKGKNMNFNLNNISSSIEIVFDSSSIETEITKKYNFDEYNINNRYYFQEEKTMKVTVGGVPTIRIICQTEQFPSAPEGEKDSENIEEINYIEKDIYNN